MRTGAMLRSLQTASAAALLLFSPSTVLALPELGEIGFNQLFGRQTECPASLACGWKGQLCCPTGATCYTDANTQAQCRTAAAPAATGGAWSMVTTTITGTGPYTVTSTYSTYIGATPTAVTPASSGCNYALNESPCGNVCCKSSQYCFTAGECRDAANGGSSGYYSSFYSTMYETTNSAGVPLRPTSSTLIIVTARPTTTASVSATTTTVSAVTQPFQTPLATGANVTVTQAQASGGGGLSGGAIAGIVIGVLVGLFLLGLICFCCCLKGLLDGCMALFGIGRKKQRKEVDEYERYSHHTSGAGAPPGRTWYGARKPAKSRHDEKKSSATKNVLGIGAVLAALWAILGLKRRNERRKNDEKYSEYSYYSSDYYTSESSASSDRRTRDDRRSRR